MRCPNCGQDNAPGVRFCGNCGTALVEGADETTVLPPPTPPIGTDVPPAPGAYPPPGATLRIDDPVAPPAPPSKVAEALTTGWGRAVGSAALTFLVMVLLGQGLAALVYAAGTGGLGIVDVIKSGGLLTFSFHRVGIHADLPSFSVPTPPDSGLGGLPQVAGQISLAFTVAISLLLGTIVLVWLLHRAGRALGAGVGGSSWARGLAGAKVALPYALITGLAALLLAAVPLSVEVPEVPDLVAGGAMELAPSVVAAFLWPLALGLLAGFTGGVSSTPDPAPEATPAEGYVAGALRGGAIAVAVAVLLAFVGVQIVAFVHPDVSFPFNPAFFSDAFANRPIQGISTTVFALFFAPNLGGLVLAPSMLSSLGFYVQGVSIPLLSLFKFPVGLNAEALAGLSGLGVPGTGTGELVETTVAPWPYWLFLLVPLVATLVGGRAAARRASAGTRGEGAAAGALAGLVYAALAFLVVLLSGVGLRFEGAVAGFTQTGAGHFGAEYLTTGLLAVLWGLVGGTLGGLMGVRGRPVAAAPVGAAYGFSTEPGPPAPPAPQAPPPP